MPNQPQANATVDLFRGTLMDTSLPGDSIFRGHLHALLDLMGNLSETERNLLSESSNMLGIIEVAAKDLLKIPRDGDLSFTRDALGAQVDNIRQTLTAALDRTQELQAIVTAKTKQLQEVATSEELTQAMDQFSFIWRCIQAYAAKLDLEKRQLLNEENKPLSDSPSAASSTRPTQSGRTARVVLGDLIRLGDSGALKLKGGTQ